MSARAAFEARWRALPAVARGVIYMTAAQSIGALMTASVRVVSESVHPFEIGLFRTAIGCLLFAPLVFRNGFGALRTQRLGTHLFRGCMVGAGVLLAFMAISLIPLTQASALGFTSPLFASLLAVLFLGERMRARRLAALAVGFAGMLVILRPDMGISAGALFAIGGALTFATGMVSIRILGQTDSNVTITAYTMICMTPIALVAALPFWTTPAIEDLGWLFAVGVFGTIHQYFFVAAYREAEVTVLTPSSFMALIWVAVVGFFAFGEVPSFWTWVGAAMIAASVTYITIREARLKARAGGSAAPGAERPAA